MGSLIPALAPPVDLRHQALAALTERVKQTIVVAVGALGLADSPAPGPRSLPRAQRQRRGTADPSRAKEDLDRSPLIHRPITLGRLLERQFKVEDLARIDLTVPDQVHEPGQEAAHRGGASVHVHVGPEQLLPSQLHVMQYPDKTDMPARAGRTDGLA
jgi:hypothetical protein